MAKRKSPRKSRPRRALIVDDDADVCHILSRLLKQEGLESLEAANGRDALGVMRRESLDLVLLDVRLPGMDGQEVLKQVKEFNGSTPIIMISGFGNIDSAVKAVKNGAYDYLTKPLDHERLALTIRRALESGFIRRECQRLRSRLDARLPLQEAMGSSEQVRRIIEEVERVAPTNYTVIIAGQTGSGKELVAQAIHQRSPRASGPFVPVDCGSIPASLIENELFGHEKGSYTGAHRTLPGKFEIASGGTLFLDEISNLPSFVQAKLLRTLQERQIWRIGGIEFLKVDVRVLAATNQDLVEMVNKGTFRRDLYHRINEFNIRIPPLRERRQDIIFLAKRFFDLATEELGKDLRGITEPALDRLLADDWPGNVRELRNVIRRAVLLADVYVEPQHLGIRENGTEAFGQLDVKDEVDGSLSLKELVRGVVEQTERKILAQALKRTGGNKAKAARLLQVDYKTIHKKVKKYGLSLSI